MAGSDGRVTGTPDLQVLERRVARVVLVDQHGAVLLLSGRNPAHPDRPDFWYTPGGGVEDGESLHDAARREVHEETGGRIAVAGTPVWSRRTEFAFDGHYFVQHESYYVVRVPRFDVRPTALTELEARTTTGWRWWPPEELAATAAPVFPPELGTLLPGWLDGR